MCNGFTDFSANREIDLVLAATAVAADILINWRRVVVEFMSGLQYEIHLFRPE